jgi:predicted dehydrogenase
VGAIGCGDVLRAYVEHLEALQGRGVAELTAACETKKGPSGSVIPECYAERVEADPESVIWSKKTELVLILGPMQEHGTMAKEALMAGKHVLVEKPMGATLAEAAELVEMAKTSKGYLICPPSVILSPTYQAISKHIADGDIGRILTARARYGWSDGWWGHWFFRGAEGVIKDLAVYNITSLTGLMGSVRRVMAMTGVALPDREVGGQHIRADAIDNVQLLMDFGESVFAVVTSGFTIEKYRSPALEIYGSDGTIQMLGDDWAPQGYELWQNRVGAWQVYPETDPQWRWTEGLGHAIQCIRRGEHPTISPQHAYHVLEIMVRAEDSGREGQAIHIESQFMPPEFGRPQMEGTSHYVHDPGRRK